MGQDNILVTAPTGLSPAFTDYRGVITNVLSGHHVEHVAVITQVKGTIRGQHYHPDEGGTQWLYLLSGRLEALVCATDKGEPTEQWPLVTSYVLDPGSLLAIPPWTAHAFRAIDRSIFLAIDEYSHAPDRYDIVTRPYPLLPAGVPV